MSSPVTSSRPVRILEGQGASRRAQDMIDTYFHELETRLHAGFSSDYLAAAAPTDLVPPNGDFLLLSEIGSSTILGFGGVRLRHAPDGELAFAHLQRMWLVPDARGRGLGKFLLRSLENRARALGALEVRLALHHTLTEAMALYVSAHYQPIEPFEDNPYVDVYMGKDL